MDAPAQTKRCPRCGEVKLLTEFHRHAARPDGRQSYCRECQRAAVRANQQARRAAGRCWQTGCPNDAAPGHTRCAQHLEAQRAYDRAAQQARRARADQ